MTPEDREKQKRSLYRLWWQKRNERTLINPRIDHNERFRQMYGETLVEYHKRLQEQEKLAGTMDFYMRAGR